MIDLRKRSVLSGVDLNVEAQTLSFLRIPAEGFHASRHARICAGHGLLASFHIPSLRSDASRRSQSAGVLLPRSVLRDGLCATDCTRVVAGHRSQFAGAIGAALPHGFSLQDDFA